MNIGILARSAPSSEFRRPEFPLIMSPKVEVTERGFGFELVQFVFVCCQRPNRMDKNEIDLRSRQKRQLNAADILLSNGKFYP